MVAVRSVLELPLFHFGVPLVSASAGLGNLDVVDGGSTLLFIDVATPFNRICVHPGTNTLLKRQLQLVDVGFNLALGNAVVHALVHGPRQPLDTLHGDLERYVPLQKVFHGAVIHAHRL